MISVTRLSTPYEYRVNSMHPDSVNYADFDVVVRKAGRGNCYKIIHRDGLRLVYDEDKNVGRDEGRPDQRFGLGTALTLATEIAPAYKVMGHTAAEVWEWEQEQTAAQERRDAEWRESHQ